MGPLGVLKLATRALPWMGKASSEEGTDSADKKVVCSESCWRSEAQQPAAGGPDQNTAMPEAGAEAAASPIESELKILVAAEVCEATKQLDMSQLVKARSWDRVPLVEQQLCNIAVPKLVKAFKKLGDRCRAAVQQQQQLVQALLQQHQSDTFQAHQCLLASLLQRTDLQQVQNQLMLLPGIQCFLIQELYVHACNEQQQALIAALTACSTAAEVQDAAATWTTQQMHAATAADPAVLISCSIWQQVQLMLTTQQLPAVVQPAAQRVWSSCSSSPALEAARQELLRFTKLLLMHCDAAAIAAAASQLSQCSDACSMLLQMEVGLVEQVTGFSGQLLQHCSMNTLEALGTLPAINRYSLLIKHFCSHQPLAAAAAEPSAEAVAAEAAVQAATALSEVELQICAAKLLECQTIADVQAALHELENVVLLHHTGLELQLIQRAEVSIAVRDAVVALKAACLGYCPSWRGWRDLMGRLRGCQSEQELFDWAARLTHAAATMAAETAAKAANSAAAPTSVPMPANAASSLSQQQQQLSDASTITEQVAQATNCIRSSLSQQQQQLSDVSTITEQVAQATNCIRSSLSQQQQLSDVSTITEQVAQATNCFRNRSSGAVGGEQAAANKVFTSRLVGQQDDISSSNSTDARRGPCRSSVGNKSSSSVDSGKSGNGVVSQPLDWRRRCRTASYRAYSSTGAIRRSSNTRLKPPGRHQPATASQTAGAAGHHNGSRMGVLGRVAGVCSKAARGLAAVAGHAGQAVQQLVGVVQTAAAAVQHVERQTFVRS